MHSTTAIAAKQYFEHKLRIEYHAKPTEGTGIEIPLAHDCHITLFLHP